MGKRRLPKDNLIANFERFEASMITRSKPPRVKAKRNPAEESDPACGHVARITIKESLGASFTNDKRPRPAASEAFV
jgi:hypothetical protein